MRARVREETGGRAAWTLGRARSQPQPMWARLRRVTCVQLAVCMSVVWCVWCMCEPCAGMHRCKHMRPRGSLCGCGWVRLWVSVTSGYASVLSQGVHD